MYREPFYQLHAAQRQLLLPLNNLENGSFRNTENLQDKKIAGSILLSLFMRTDRKCNNFTPSSTCLSGILFSVKQNIPEGPKYENNIDTISMNREKFYQLHEAQRQLLQPLNNLKIRWILQIYREPKI